MRKSICLLSFSPIDRDSRVLRQIKFLAPHYDLTIVGYGKPHPQWQHLPTVRWLTVEPMKPKTYLVLFYLLLGKIWSKAYEHWYWLKPHYRQALDRLKSFYFDAILANEWDSLPIAMSIKGGSNCPILFDAHEDTIGQHRSAGILKSWLFTPAIKFLMKESAYSIAASTTVVESIAKKLNQEFGLSPIVILNTPEYQEVPNHKLVPTRIRMIHHGIAQRNRHLEDMIYALALCEQRYELCMMLIEHDKGYIKELKNLASKIAPGRVSFVEPVSPEKIIQTIHPFDVGLYILNPVIENFYYSLPNKFFDFIMAGLAVCIGPSPAMASIIRKYKCGCIAPTFDPSDVADLLNKTSIEEWEAMRQRAKKAAKELNAENEMSKLLAIIEKCLNES